MYYYILAVVVGETSQTTLDTDRTLFVTDGKIRLAERMRIVNTGVLLKLVEANLANDNVAGVTIRKAPGTHAQSRIERIILNGSIHG